MTTKKNPRKRSRKLSHSDAVSAGMLELSAARRKARVKRNGIPAKHAIFELWLKACKAGKELDREEIAKKFADVKLGTINAWVGSWHGETPNFPSIADGRKAEITAALKAYAKKNS